jgi:hypothetical protein
MHRIIIWLSHWPRDKGPKTAVTIIIDMILFHKRKKKIRMIPVIGGSENQGHQPLIAYWNYVSAGSPYLQTVGDKSQAAFLVGADFAALSSSALLSFFSSAFLGAKVASFVSGFFSAAGAWASTAPSKVQRSITFFIFKF